MGFGRARGAIRAGRTRKIPFTRTCSCRNNGTCYAGQTNWSIVRRFPGYRRYGSEAACAELNLLFASVQDYVNYLMPSMKLVEKIRAAPG